MEVLAKLGIDWKLLIAQAVNFVVLLWVLRLYAYRPILRALEARTKKIEQGLQDAAQSQKKLQAVVEEEKQIMAAAREEARDILLKAETSAKERDAQMLQPVDGQLIAGKPRRIVVDRESCAAAEGDRSDGARDDTATGGGQ